jgi:hypothetical protein
VHLSLVDLNRKVFGKITAKEILGAVPELQTTREKLESEFQALGKNLENKNRSQLENLLGEQLNAHKEINSRPGAMALSQSKIRLFSEYSQKYMDMIKKRLG